MNRYYVELRKHIVVPVATDDEETARTLAVNLSWDLMWQQALAHVVRVQQVADLPKQSVSSIPLADLIRAVLDGKAVQHFWHGQWNDEAPADAV